eukprot:11155090-Lingulodinium_polyedra.AAC.1
MAAVGEAQRAGATAAAEQAARANAAEARTASVENDEQNLQRFEALRVAQLQNVAQQFGGVATRLGEIEARI